MTELERALLAVGQNLEVPAAPDLTGAVRARLAEGRRPSLFSRRMLVVALAVLAVAVGAVLAVPQARSTIKDWLGIGNVTIRYVEELPPVEQATDDLGLGEQMSLEEARERAGFQVRVPTVEGLDDPPKVFYNESSSQVAFLYGSEDKPKLLITQADARGAIEKLVNLNVTERSSSSSSPATPVSGSSARSTRSSTRAPTTRSLSGWSGTRSCTRSTA